MNLPQRKPNRLREYDYSASGIYFITICTQNRLKTLSEIVGDGFPVPRLTVNGVIVDRVIKEIPERYACVKVDKYTIMPNHIHLMLQIIKDSGTGNPSPTIGTVIAWLKYQTTKQVNLLYGTYGNRLFQRSFHDHIIRNKREYIKIWRYIDDNASMWERDCFYC